MTIETAEFVVQRGSAQFKCAGADLIDKLQAGDLMAVTRPGDDTYKWVRPTTKYKYRYTIDTEGKTVGNTSFKLSVLTDFSTLILFDVNWGDGTEDTGVTDDEILHTYPSPGIYSIEVTTDELHPWRTGRGSVDEMSMILSFDGCDDGFPFGGSIQNMFFTAGNLTSIEPFDTTGITNFNAAFNGLSSFSGSTLPLFDTSSGISFNGAFVGGPWSSFPLIDTSKGENFRETWSYCMQLTSFPQLNLSNGTNFSEAWKYCTGLTSFPQFDLSSATDLSGAWSDCSNLSSFPQYTFPKATTLESAWQNCTSLTSFPLIDISSPTLLALDYAWKGCSGLTSFPDLDYSSVERMSYAWQNCTDLVAWNSNATVNLPEVVSLDAAWFGCTSLTSMPALNIPKATSLLFCCASCSNLASIPFFDTSNIANWLGTFFQCNLLVTIPAFSFSSATSFSQCFEDTIALTTFPPNMFDVTGTLASNAFSRAFKNSALTATSIENILVSLDTNGQSNITLDIDGGTNASQSTWTAAANTAYNNLVTKGWTITFNT